MPPRGGGEGRRGAVSSTCVVTGAPLNERKLPVCLEICAYTLLDIYIDRYLDLCLENVLNTCV